jgi:hypothetical protein
MGYLNNASVTVDAILTTKGRQKLAAGTTNGLGISYFALGDDEVDYDLWNPAHPLGSDYYGIVIENMPVLEASPIPEQNLKSKLITLPKGTTQLAYIQASPPGVTSTQFKVRVGSGQWVTSNSLEFTLSLGGIGQSGANNDTFGYTVYYDSRYIDITRLTAPSAGAGAFNSMTSGIGDSSGTLDGYITGNKFSINLNGITINRDFSPFIGKTITLNIIIQGNEIGGQVNIPVPVTFTA